MSPVRNVSQPLADVMQRAERRGARSERKRLQDRAQAAHVSAGHEPPGGDYRCCTHPSCRALTEVLADPPGDPEATDRRSTDLARQPGRAGGPSA